jgi:deoxyadenosine/deoxycytidine kinase
MIIYLEGNIGSGKSTFVEFLQSYIDTKQLDADVILEPVDEWLVTQDNQGTNILEHYYQDAKKYGFTFQINALLSRVKKIQDKIKNSKKSVHFVERSIYTDKNVFLECNYQNGNISHMEYVIYHQWFDWILENFNHRPDGIVYLNTKPEICEQRINERNRNGEDGIPLEYLKTLDKFHLLWLEKETDIPIIYLDSNINFYENQDKKQEEILRVIQLADTIYTERIRIC